MSHVRFVTRVRAAKSQTVELHTATLSRKPFHDPPPQTQFQNSETSISTGVNPAGDTSPNILVGGTSTGISPQYYYVLSDIADQYWLPSVRSASSRFHSAIRRHQFASVRQSAHKARPPNLELALNYNYCISNLFWTLRSIVRFRFAKQPTKTKPLPTISQSVVSVWFVAACNWLSNIMWMLTVVFLLLLYCTDFIIYALYM